MTYTFKTLSEALQYAVEHKCVGDMIIRQTKDGYALVVKPMRGDDEERTV